ncbi:MAG: cupin domain-containing protein [Rhodospirillales bacterium]|jgi:quercetin dioxygenase-like cupin family protein
MKYFHRIIDEDRKSIKSKTSTAHAAVIKGERITAGLVQKEQGSGSQPHRHPKLEQFNFIIKGKFKSMVEGEHHIMEEGDMVHIPPNALHQMVAVGEGENIYFMAKDTISDPERWIYGEAEDKTATKPWYEPGFDPDEKK